MAYPVWIFVCVVSLMASFACKTINRQTKTPHDFRDDARPPQVKAIYQMQHQRDQIASKLALINRGVCAWH
jgi:hypothetical protein